ncbi:alkaline phosphatase D family protein [Roseateles microcysteis]|uniref:alkaline phosphatase D family protein n=1 Tax=Roseateles microcysteis TaxID=3119057 RepID=UPI002FE55C51
MNRRDWLRMATAASLGQWGSLSKAAPLLEVDPFQLGVASGMPSATGIVLWTRLLPLNTLRNPWGDAPLDVRWELADDASFSKLVRTGTAQALPQLAHSVHVEVEGLEPGRHYHYRFLVGGAVSPTGRTRTLPAPDEPVQRLRLGVASCQRLANGYFGAYSRMLEENLDAMTFLGDYIYDSGAWPSAILPRGLEPARTLDGYRLHYETHKREQALQEAHAALPWLLIWDDHEVLNDYAGSPARGLAPGTEARQRRAAYQAYYEHMPLRLASLVRGMQGLTQDGEELRIYGRAQWGQLASMHLLDCRQYRDAQACSGVGGMIETPVCDAMLDPKRTMLGAEQEAWLHAGLAKQRRGEGQAWNLLLQTTMFSPRKIPVLGKQRVWNDGWDGYPAARERLIASLVGQDVAGPVFIGGDLHENWACNVPGGSGEAARQTVASEFVVTGITMSSFFPKMIADIKAANPHAQFAQAGKCGYAVVEVTPKQVQTSFMTINSIATLEPTVSLAARFNVEAGDPKLVAG